MRTINKKYQQYLFDISLYQGYIDGDYGPKTETAVKKFQTMNGLFADGVIGPKTIAVFEEHIKNNSTHSAESNSSLPSSHPYTRWPKEVESELLRFYGNVGENQVRIDLPYKMVLAWDTNTEITKITCHTKVADSLYTILDNVRKSYSEQDIRRHGFNLFGGTLNVRKIRGGNRWSTHAWGIAIDIDPARNGLTISWANSYLSKPECKTFIDCFRNEGWYSLGLEKNFDSMHMQACYR
jgi:hypothetical protein